MFDGLSSLNGIKIKYDEHEGKIVKAWIKHDVPYISVEFQDEKGNIRKENALIDARTYGRIRILNSCLEYDEYGKYMVIIKKTAEEYIKSVLTSAYKNAYSVVLGKKDPHEIRPAFSSDDSDRANLKWAVKMALKGMPEAIFEICDNHREFARLLEDAFSPEQLALFGHRSGRFIGCSFTKIYTARADVRDRIMEQREIAICGTEDGYYGENGVTWNHIKEKILPIATADIWDYLNDFFNGPDALVDPEDRTKFNEQYHARYVSPIVMEVPSQSGEKTDTKKSFSEIVEFTLNEVSEENYDLIEKKLSKCSDRQKAIIAYSIAVKSSSAYYIRNNPELERLVQRSRKILVKLPEKTIRSLMNELSFNEQTGLVDCIRMQTGSSVPEPWAILFKELFEKSLSTENVRWWIGTLDSFSLLFQYSENFAFWSDIKPSRLMQLIGQFYDSMIPERFLAFAENACLYCMNNDQKNLEICKCWKKYILKSVFELPDNDVSARIFSSTLLKIFSNEELPALFEQLFHIMASNHKTEIIENKVEQHDDLPAKLLSQMRGFADLEMTVINRRGLENDAVITDILRRILQIKRDLSYLSEHEWRTAITPVIDESKFLDFAGIPFNSAIHKSNEFLEEETMVKALSSGLKLGDEVKQKAVVVAIKGGSL